MNICEIDLQSRFGARDRVVRASVLGWPWGMGWGGRWKGGSGWGIHVHPRLIHVSSVQFSSFAQLCPTLCDSMNCSTPGLPIYHQLPESTQTHVHWVGDAIQPSHSLSPHFFSCPQSFPASGSFPVSQLFASGGQSIEVSASTSVLPMNTQTELL